MIMMIDDFNQDMSEADRYGRRQPADALDWGAANAASTEQDVPDKLQVCALYFQVRM